MKISWESRAWDEYLQWQTIDKNTLKRINQLIKDIQRQPFTGIGKPEPLKGPLSRYWSRRIDDTHRLVYIIEDDTLTIIQCGGHYGQ